MAVLITFVFGAPFFLFGMTHDSGRAARGLASSEAWFMAWLLGVTLVVLPFKARRDARTGAGPLLGLPTALTTTLVVLGWAVATAGIIALRAGDFGMSPTAGALLLVFFVAPFVFLTSLLVTRARAESSAPDEGHIPDAFDVANAALPWLLPALVLFALRVIPVQEPWRDQISGTGVAGIMFLQI